MKQILKLFVAGSGAGAQTAVRNFNRFVDDFLDGDAETEVIDILDQPGKAREHRVIATPLLVRLEPSPIRKVIGDLSNTVGVCTGLGIDMPSNRSATQDRKSADD